MFLFIQVLKVKARYGNKVLFRIIATWTVLTQYGQKYFGNKLDAANVN